VQLVIGKIVQGLRQDGLRKTLERAFSLFVESSETDDFDLKHGTDTGSPAPLWKFRIASPNRRFGTRYQASDEQEILDAIKTLDENLQTFVFVDLGCGKGRTLLVAANLGFKQVIGVEFVRELAEIARTNLEKMGVTNAIVEQRDAADFQIPNGNSIVYLYNPFSQEVVRKVLARLRQAQINKLYIVYKVAECAEVLDQTGFLVRLGSPERRQYIKIWKWIS
jgi:SAM-dependent methyltransferase